MGEGRGRSRPVLPPPVPVWPAGWQEPLLLREARYAPGERQPPHAHDRASITMLLAGSLTESGLGREVRAGPLSVVAKPAGMVHADHFGPSGARTLQVLFPRERAAAGSAPRRWCWSHAGVVCRSFFAMYESLDEPDGARLAESVRAVLASLREGRAATRDAPPAWLARVAATLDAGFRDPPRLSALAAELGVHPGSLSRSLRRHYGAGPRERVRRRRVRAAAALLTGTRLSVAEVAARTGFADQSQLARTFSTVVGCPPSRFRARIGFETFKTEGREGA